MTAVQNKDAIHTHTDIQPRSRNKSALAAMWQDGRGRTGFVILVVLVLVAVVGRWLPIHPFAPDVNNILSPPGLHHPLGTDEIGRDVLQRVIWGSQSSLLIGFGSVVASLIIGIVIGNIAGYVGGVVDSFLSACINVGLSMPPMLIAIATVAVAGPGAVQLIVAITFAYAPKVVRLQRSLTLSWKTRSFVDAARLGGVRTRTIVIRHIVPNTLAPMVVAGTVQVGNAVIVAASLSFLGLGIPLPDPSWGNIVAEGVPHLQDAWWISTLPALVIVLTTIALHFVADASRRILDPAHEAELV